MSSQTYGAVFASLANGLEKLTGKSDDARREALDDSIQTCCGALLALHAGVRSLEAIPDEHVEVKHELEVAIELVRAAVDQLQMLPADAPAMPPGFVDRRLARPGEGESQPQKKAD